MKNKLRIIAGDWRGRQLRFAEVPGLRPTPDRIRETLFNWLQYDVPGSHCLDLYAGSGALGFEAASRGAGKVVQVENNDLACRYLKENAQMLAASRLTIINREVLRFLARDPEPFDLVFMDPPFSKNLVLPTCHRLEDNGWLAVRAKIYVESERALEADGWPATWTLLKDKRAGDVAYRLFERLAH